MNRPLSHEETAELLGAFALDAVDDDERTKIEDHLRDCPRCRAEVAQHQEVAARLAFGGGAAPDGLWGRIAAALEPSEPEPDLARLYPLRERRQRHWALRGLTVAAAVLAVALGGLGWVLHNEQNRVTNISKIALLRGRMDAAQADPRSTRLNLTSRDRRIAINVVVTAAGQGYFDAEGSLPPLPASQTYELWGSSGGETTALGVLGNRPPVIVPFRQPVNGLVGMAVTAERAGGVTQTTKTPLVSGTVS